MPLLIKMQSDVLIFLKEIVDTLLFFILNGRRISCELTSSIIRVAKVRWFKWLLKQRVWYRKRSRRCCKWCRSISSWLSYAKWMPKRTRNKNAERIWWSIRFAGCASEHCFVHQLSFKKCSSCTRITIIWMLNDTCITAMLYWSNLRPHIGWIAFRRWCRCSSFIKCIKVIIIKKWFESSWRNNFKARRWFSWASCSRTWICSIITAKAIRLKIKGSWTCGERWRLGKCKRLKR